MVPDQRLDGRCLDIIKNVLQTASEKAASSITMMIDSSVKTEIVDIQNDPFGIVDEKYDKESLGVIIYSELKEGEGGITLFILEERSARELCEILLGEEKCTGADELSEEEKSAIRETGNILIGNFLAEVGDYFDTPILHTPPQLVHDMIGVYIENLVGYSENVNEPIIADVSLTVEEIGVNGRYILFPSDKLTQRFLEHAGE